MATTNDLKNGLVLNLDGQLWSVVEFQHVKPGKGGAFVRTKLKNVLSGKVVDKTFNAGIKVETATVDKRDMQYLYKEGTDFVFMDTRPTTRSTSRPTTVGDGAELHAGEPGRRRRDARGHRRCTSSCPPSVELTIAYTEPGHAGRPLDRRHQAGHARDRRRDRGPAVHHHRREGQGRHPRRVATSAASTGS